MGGSNSDNFDDLFYAPKGMKSTNANTSAKARTKTWVLKEDDTDTFDDLFYVPKSANGNTNTNTNTGSFYSEYASPSTSTLVPFISRSVFSTLTSDEEDGKFDDLFVKPAPPPPPSTSTLSSYSSCSTPPHKVQQPDSCNDNLIPRSLNVSSNDEFDNLLINPGLPHPTAEGMYLENRDKPQLYRLSIETDDDDNEEFEDLFVKPTPLPVSNDNGGSFSSISTTGDEDVENGKKDEDVNGQRRQGGGEQDHTSTTGTVNVGDLSANPFFSMNFSNKTNTKKTRKPLSLSMNAEDYEDLFVKPKPVFGPERPPSQPIPIHPIFENDYHKRVFETYDPVCIILEDMNGTLEENMLRDIYERRCWRISKWSEGEFHGLRLRDEVCESPDSKKQVFLEWEDDFREGCVWIEMFGVEEGIQKVIKEYIGVVDEEKYTWDTMEMATRRFTSFINHKVYTWRYHPPENLEMQWECVDDGGETVAYWSLKLPLEPEYFSSGRTLTILDGHEHLTLEMVTTCIIVRKFQDYYHELAEERREREEPGYKMRRMKEEIDEVEKLGMAGIVVDAKNGRWTPSPPSSESSSEDENEGEDGGKGGVVGVGTSAGAGVVGEMSDVD